MGNNKPLLWTAILAAAGTGSAMAQITGTPKAGEYYFKNVESGKAGVVRIAEFELGKLEVSFVINNEYKDMVYTTPSGSTTKNAETLIRNCKKYEQVATVAAAGEPSILNWVTPYKNLLAAYEELKSAMDSATGIVGIEADANVEAPELNGEAYDLSGRRVGKLNKGGIYIVGGKKLIK